MWDLLAEPDAVNLVMSIEEVFGIEITDAEAERLRTVGELYELVLSKGVREQPARCFTATAFCRLRAAMVEAWGVERRRVRPGVRLEELVPREGRRSAWRRLRKRSGLRLPSLEWPGRVMALNRWFGRIGLWGVPAVTVVVLIAAGWGEGPWWWVLATALSLGLVGGLFGVAGAVVLMLVTQLATLHWAREFPASAPTAGRLAEQVAALNFERLRGKAEGFHLDASETLRMLIAQEAGVHPDEVTPEKDLLRDILV